MKLEAKSFASADETQTFPHGHVDLVTLGGYAVGRTVLEPGWRWSQDIKPIAGTDLCQETHVIVVLSGRVGASLPTGEVVECGPGEVFAIPPGHDGWVAGSEPAILIDWARPEDVPNWQAPGA